MNNQKLKEKVRISMQKQISDRGFVAPVDVLMDLNVLLKRDYDRWRRGQVPFLERVIQMNLNKLATFSKEVRSYAKELGLKPSQTIYQAHGGKKGKAGTLKFSKSGSPQIEKHYATHYIDREKIAQLKANKQK